MKPNVWNALRMALLILQSQRSKLDAEDKETLDSLQAWYESNKSKKSRRKD